MKTNRVHYIFHVTEIKDPNIFYLECVSSIKKSTTKVVCIHEVCCNILYILLFHIFPVLHSKNKIKYTEKSEEMKK